ncbi:MAG: hypothetical protein KAW09_00380, partial [Thermoplasmata archaeon]|nr:hypothetical protein [Thermoplasmata archaeon]
MVEQFDLEKYLDTLTTALETGKYRETSYIAKHREDFRNTFIETHVESFVDLVTRLQNMHGYFDIDEILQDPSSDRKALEQIEKFFSNLNKVQSIDAEEINQLVKKKGLLYDEGQCKFKDREQIWNELVCVIDELKSNGHLYISYLNETGELSECVKDVFDVVCHYSLCSHTDLRIIKSVEMFETFRNVCFPRGYTDQQRYSEVFGGWLFATDMAQKRLEAAKVFGILISNLRSRAIQSKVIEQWTESLSKFEELIIFVKSRIEEKGFYRDHLNHIIRVCLILMMLLHK